MDLGLKGRRALVTAASRGLGRACAEALIAEGARVYISSRDAASIEATGRAVNASGWSTADVSKPGNAESLVGAAISSLGGLDVLVVNAGGPPPGTFQGTPLESWEPGFELTLMSAVRLVKSALPALKESDQGRIVFITSISVRQPLANIVISNAMRGAVTGLAKTLSRELASERISVNCLAPDAILTDRTRNLAAAAGHDVEAHLREAAERLPMGRYGTPQEFGAACAFLCSRPAAYISGQTLGVDGAALAGVH
jgi:3-oxoacyl-[acyl-carrier protein] reductase